MENSTITQNWKALIKPGKLNIKSNEDKTIIIFCSFTIYH